MKVLRLFLAGLLLFGGIALADENGMETFLRGDDTEDPLMVDLGIAKIIEVENGAIIPVLGQLNALRVQFDRQSNIGNISNAEYTVSAILEF